MQDQLPARRREDWALPDPRHLSDDDYRAVRDAIAAGATQTGASVIVVDDGVDTGPIVVQERVPVHDGDTEGALHDRIKLVERELLVRVVLDIANGEVDLARL